MILCFDYFLVQTKFGLPLLKQQAMIAIANKKMFDKAFNCKTWLLNKPSHSLHKKAAKQSELSGLILWAKS